MLEIQFSNNLGNASDKKNKKKKHPPHKEYHRYSILITKSKTILKGHIALLFIVIYQVI